MSGHNGGHSGGHSLSGETLPEALPGSKRPRKRIGFRGVFNLLLPAGWLAGIFFFGMMAPFLPLQDPNELDLLSQSIPPDAAHWFGTDDLGRDMFSRAIHGARISLTVGLIAPLIALVIGCALGVTAGYFRGRWETSVLLYVDVSLAFPGIILLLLLVTTLGNSLFNLTTALGILIVPAYTRVSRANTLTFAERDFVMAARALGASHFRIIFREILPNVMLPVLAYTFVLVALIIVLEGVLSFLALGVPHPAPSWGSMISEGRELMADSPHVSFIPAGVMFLTVLSFNLLGDTLRRKIDTRSASL